MTVAGDAGLPVLYSFRRCPYAIRARLAIRASGTTVEWREVALRDKPPSLVAHFPAGVTATVPVLCLPDGAIALQSLDIMRWALRLHDPQGWLRDDEDSEAQRLIAVNDGPFKQLLDRYKYAPRHPERHAAEWRDQAVETLLADLDARVARHGHLLRETPSLADMAIVPFVRQFAAVDAAWFDACPLGALRGWLRMLAGGSLFASVMQARAPWRAGDPAVIL